MDANRDKVRELRDQLSARLGERAAFSSTVYRDAPIIMTANQLKSFTPEPVRQMRALSKQLKTRGLSIAQRFVEEARVLATCDDEFSGVAPFSCYFPTYDDMDDAQLRTYLTWRARVRAGHVEKTSTSFAFVYIYELINQVGVEDDRLGWEALHAFVKAYGQLDASIARLGATWADDYVVYYNLPAELLETLPEREDDQARSAVLHADNRDDDALFDALAHLSAYRVAGSAFAAEHPDDFQRVAVRTYRRLAAHYAKTTKSYADRLLGTRRVVAYEPFARSVFADPRHWTDMTYRVGPLDTIHCRAGAWSRVRFTELKKTRKQLGELLKTIDARMRVVWGDERGLEAPSTAKFLLKIVDEEAHSALVDRRAAEARAVRIDFGKLDAIRAAADATADKLIVEEDEAVVQTLAAPTSSPAETVAFPTLEEAVPAVAQVADPSAPGERSDSSDDGVLTLALTDDERRLLAALMEGASVRAFESDHGVMASLVAESVNEKLYDLFDDIVIDAAVEPPVLIEDYREDIAALLANST